MIAAALKKACSSLWELQEVVHHNYWAHAVGLVVAPVRLLVVGVVAGFVGVVVVPVVAVEPAAGFVAVVAVAEAQVVASFVVVRQTWKLGMEED